LPVIIISAFYFSSDFRISRQSFYHLVREIRPAKRHGWDVEIEVMMFLFWIGCGASYRVVGRTFGIPRTTCFKLINDVLERVISLLNSVIALPTNDEIIEIQQGFR